MNYNVKDNSLVFSEYNSFGLSTNIEEVNLISCPKILLETIQQRPSKVFGELSNTLVGEEIKEPLILFRDGKINKITTNDKNYIINVQGSCALDTLIENIIKKNIAGLELLSGIPGTVGAGIVQNVGAYGAQISTYLHSAKVLNLTDGTINILKSDEFNFKYRNSSLKHSKDKNKKIILDATFHIPINNDISLLTYDGLKKHHATKGRSLSNLTEIRKTVLEVRSRKGMVINCKGWSPCAGSYFISPAVKEDIARNIAISVRGESFADDFLKWYKPDNNHIRVPAALVLRAAGFLNGDTWGNVGLSKQHILALTTKTGATGSDIANLANHIKKVVYDKLNIELEQEILHLGEFHNINEKKFILEKKYTPGTKEPLWVKT